MAHVEIKNAGTGELMLVIKDASGATTDKVELEKGKRYSADLEPGAVIKVKAVPPADEPEQPQSDEPAVTLSPEGIESAEAVGKKE